MSSRGEVIGAATKDAPNLSHGLTPAKQQRRVIHGDSRNTFAYLSPRGLEWQTSGTETHGGSPSHSPQSGSGTEKPGLVFAPSFRAVVGVVSDKNLSEVIGPRFGVFLSTQFGGAGLVAGPHEIRFGGNPDRLPGSDHQRDPVEAGSFSEVLS